MSQERFEKRTNPAFFTVIPCIFQSPVCSLGLASSNGVVDLMTSVRVSWQAGKIAERESRAMAISGSSPRNTSRQFRFSATIPARLGPITPGITHALTTATRATIVPGARRRRAASMSQAIAKPMTSCSVTDPVTKITVTTTMP
jgi:hypothetical protein